MKNVETLCCKPFHSYVSSGPENNLAQNEYFLLNEMFKMKISVSSTAEEDNIDSLIIPFLMTRGKMSN
uniref:Uncharacterized protein n=1 Tax=Caenorhabditis japonica TaxID=281687 RepID=A0A8R1E613_CAEJA